MPWRELTPKVLAGFLFPSLGGLLFGFDIGATSGAISEDQVLKDFHIQGAWLVGGLTSMSLYGALLSSFLLFFVGDLIGRKREMILAAALYFGGSVWSTLTPSGPMGIAWLCLGRLAYGLGIGCAMHSVPAYISEMAPSGVRGMLIACKEAMIVLGMLTGYIVSALFIQMVGGWRWMYLGGAPLAIIFGVGVGFLPDSPRWLLLKSLSSPHRFPRSKARAALAWFRAPRATSSDVDRELAEIIDTLAGQEVGTFRELRKCGRALVVGNGLLLFQQITGQPSVLYYAVSIFKSAGFGHSSSTLASVGVAGVKLLATLLASLKVDEYGRRALLLVGTAGIAVSLILIGFAFHFGYEGSGSDPSGGLTRVWGQVTVAGMLLLVTAYQLGFGPISWLMISEIFPLRVRGMALSVGSLVNFGSNIVVALAFPSILSTLGQAPAFWMFAGIAVLAFVFVLVAVPETKGKSLEEIEALLQSKSRSPCAEPSLRDPLVESMYDGVGA